LCDRYLQKPESIRAFLLIVIPIGMVRNWGTKAPVYNDAVGSCPMPSYVSRHCRKVDLDPELVQAVEQHSAPIIPTDARRANMKVLFQAGVSSR
jgi:hypothetical protein